MRLRVAACRMGVLALLSSAPLHAQENVTRDEFWPEVDAYVNLTDRSRLFFLATVARNRGEDFAEGMVGAHVDVFVKPFARPWLAHTYYCRQNDSRASIAHVDAFGLALNLFF